jgi:GNAT superfamily N-acetyltransferase
VSSNHPDVQVRPATAADVDRLVEIEVSAGQSFHGLGLHAVAADVLDPADVLEAIRSAQAWVAEVGTDPAAYVRAELLDGNAHIAQVSVAAEYAGRRIGRTLIRYVEEWGRERGCPATTLTTFRDVPWNGPYYAGLGYRVLDESEIGPELAAVIAHEAELPGVADAPRCAMIRAGGD